jgi:hypothetical protein
MQPMDCGFMTPLQTQYVRETEMWLGSNPGRVVSPVVLSQLFGPAYGSTATIGSFTLLVSRFSLTHLATPRLTSLRSTLTFSGPCIVIYSCNESQQAALFLRFI